MERNEPVKGSKIEFLQAGKNYSLKMTTCQYFIDRILLF
jgi:hypothetical protein